MSYIHLNPLRAGMVKRIEELDHYPYSGHGALMGGLMKSWQEMNEILKFFNRLAMARRRHRQFAGRGIGQGRRHDLTGDGLIRSAGGWERLKQKQEEGQRQQSDERILGARDFVGGILERSKKSLTKRQKLTSKGMDVDKIVSHLARLQGLSVDDVWAAGKQQHIYLIS